MYVLLMHMYKYMGTRKKRKGGREGERVNSRQLSEKLEIIIRLFLHFLTLGTHYSLFD